jgi:hypothetical protein
MLLTLVLAFYSTLCSLLVLLGPSYLLPGTLPLPYPTHRVYECYPRNPQSNYATLEPTILPTNPPKILARVALAGKVSFCLGGRNRYPVQLLLSGSGLAPKKTGLKDSSLILEWT